MTTMKLSLRLVGALACVGVCIAAQDEGERPRPAIEEMVPGATPDPQEEMVQLFQSVERRLKDMGSYLLDAGAGDRTKLIEMGQSGILDLLEDGSSNAPQATGGVADLLSISRSEGRQVLEEIEQILKIAQENGGT